MPENYVKLRVIVEDDHELAREGLRNMIQKIKSIEIVGEAEDGQELIKLTRKLKPDVLLVDVKMPKCNGIEATKIIKKQFPHIGIVAISSFDEEDLVMDMLNAGATGYLLKNASIKEISDAVNAAYKDEPYYCEEISLKLVKMIYSGGRYIKENKVNALFNEKELFIILKICDGLSSKEIADLMELNTITIQSYRDNIL
jgi:DNA-binding NarL/FixJ family response regulator